MSIAKKPKISALKIVEALKKQGCKKVKLAITDMDGVLRGKVVKFEKFESIVKSGFGFCDVVFGWDINDTSYNTDEVKFTGWHTGFPDANAFVDLNTFRKIPWENNLPFFLADFKNKQGAPLEICPRQLLKSVKADCEAMGFSATMAQEFEWFNFREDSNELNDGKFFEPEPLTRGMFGYSILRAAQNSEFFNELFDLLTQFRIPIEGIHTETGPGVYEAAIVYDDVLESADRAVLFKASVKEIASRHGIIPSFMAKWNEKLPGCGGHVHQSLWKNGKNVFFDDKDKNKMSELMKSYVAGQLHCLPHILPMIAPNINSFKRLVEGMWAPTTLTWGIDNRTVAIRVLPGSASSTRIEHRVIGSDVNPYLAMAASLASGLYGIKHKLKLKTAMTVGNGYVDKKNGVLPRSLWDATEMMQNSKIAKELFGKDFVDHFCATRRWECREQAKVVTDWELKRYFELV